MSSHYFERVHVERVVLGLAQETGALIVHMLEEQRGTSIRVWKQFGSILEETYYANVIEKTVNGEKAFVALFPCLPHGNYWVSLLDNSRSGLVSIFPEEIAEVDWR